MSDKKPAEAKSAEAKVNLIKVLVKRSIWVDGETKAVKVKAGTVAELTPEQVKQFGSAVTRDVPEDE